VERLVQDRHWDSDPHQHIHVAWVCISEDSRRVEEAESQLTHTLAKYIPVVGVITKARADRGGNFMAALSLLSYTEFAGRLMLSDFSDGNFRKSFDEFFRDMGTGYDDLLKKHNVYKILRCGLAHESFVKKSCTIAMLSSRPQPGVQRDGTKYIFIVEAYLNDFRSAIDKLATQLFP
jgi:hypothetical protein